MGGSNFVLQWPSDSGKITVPYDAATGVVRIAAAAGASVKAAAAGKVTVVAADRIEIASDNYLLVYGNLRKVTPIVGQTVNAGVSLGESAGPDISLAVRQTIDPYRSTISVQSVTGKAGNDWLNRCLAPPSNDMGA